MAVVESLARACANACPDTWRSNCACCCRCPKNSSSSVWTLLRMPVSINAISAGELIRINGTLQEPHLLIGGLAVEQYCKGRDSKDIDLVCSHDVALSLLKLYKRNE